MCVCTCARACVRVCKFVGHCLNHVHTTMVSSFHPAQVSHSIDEGFIKSSGLEELMVISSEPVDLVDKLCLRAQESCKDQSSQS